MNSWRSSEFCAWAPPLITFMSGTGQHTGGVAAQAAVERYADLERRHLRDCKRYAEYRVGSEARLVRSPVELEEEPVDGRLVVCVHAGQGRGDLALDVRDGPEHALAEVDTGVAVSQLDRLELPGRGARGHRSAADHARVERDLDLDGRVSPRVENLPRVNVSDLHARSSFARL